VGVTPLVLFFSCRYWRERIGRDLQKAVTQIEPQDASRDLVKRFLFLITGLCGRGCPCHTGSALRAAESGGRVAGETLPCLQRELP